MACINALVVDDHNLFRSALKALLRPHGIVVIAEAASAAEAARHLLTNRFDVKPDLLLIDYELPDLNGAQLVRGIRQRQDRTPILMLSMHSDAITVRAAFDAGANGYVTKSAESDELVAAIRQVASGNTYLPKRLADMLKKRSSRSLTDRQLEILEHVAHGRTNEEIARELHVSISTVKGDIRALFAAMGCQERTRLVSEASRRGLLGGGGRSSVRQRKKLGTPERVL